MAEEKIQYKVDSDDYLTNAAIGYDIEPKEGDVVYVDFSTNMNMTVKDKLAFGSRYVITKIDKSKITLVSLFDAYGDRPEKYVPGRKDDTDPTALEKPTVVIDRKDIARLYYHAHSNMWVMYVIDDSGSAMEIQKMEPTKIQNPEKKNTKPNVDTYGKTDKKTEPMKKVKIV